MHRVLTIFLLAAFTLSVSAASRTELNANIRAAITELKTNPAADELAQASAGMLVFPKVVKGGFIVGGEYGKGALLVGGSIIQYYRLASVSVGFTFKNKGLMGGVSFEGSKFWKDGDPIPKKLAAN